MSRIQLVHIARTIARHRWMIWALTVREIQNRYAGTMAGVIWTFVHPVAIIGTFYFVFAVGFRMQTIENIPYALWFVVGFVPWLLFSEALTSITTTITRNAHFIKKTIFPSEVLPLVHLLVSLVSHAIFGLVLFCLLIYYDIKFHIEQLFVLYYLFCLCALALGIGWFLASLQVFYQDIAHGLGVILNLWFWATPIVWSFEKLPEGYKDVLAFNPLSYVIEGYRSSLISEAAVSSTAWQGLYFWGVTGCIVLLGLYVFNRLKREFVDVL